MKQRPLSRAIVVLSVACILVINGLVFVLVQAFSKSLAEVQASRFVTAYLDSSLHPTREAEVLSAVRKIPGVNSAQLISKDAFLDNMGRYFPQLAGELSELDMEAIPRYVKVKVTGDTSKEVSARLKKLNGVESVELNKQRYEGLIRVLVSLRRLAMGLLCGMSIALLCVFLNHFKLDTGFQSQVRNTLKILGARGPQVLLPFALEGILEGGAGGLLAAVAVLGTGKLFENQLNNMFSAMGYHPYHFNLHFIALGLMGIGILSGMIGSLWAATRFKT